MDTYHPDEAAVDAGKVKLTMDGFVTEQATTYKTTNVTRAAEAINYYTQGHIPVLTAMARSGVLFDRWFADVPGPTNPNRAYITSGTSHGYGENNNGVGAMPQNNIFQQASEHNVSWINYYNSSFAPDSMFYQYTTRNNLTKDHVKPIAQFFADAQDGKLPQLTYINPECCSYDSFHPPSPISTGEAFVKKIYEAVRGSPQWNETLFILSFDEHGGFGDHVPPPVGVPAGDDLTYTAVAPDGKSYTFDFKRLGVRVPTILMSPYLGNDVIESKAQRNEYSHSSIPAFLRNLWGWENLTPRTEYAATFEHLFQQKPMDKPATLPDPVQF
jgi:phospholipase C